MFDLDKWQEIYYSLKKHKLRTALTAFGVFWGIFMLIVLMGAGTGLRNGVMQDFDIAKNAVFVWSEQTSLPYQGLQPGRRINFKNSDIDAIRANVKDIEVISPRNVLQGDFRVTRGNKSVSFQVYGDYPDYVHVKPMIITGGRFINHHDIRDRRKVAIIGAQVKNRLYDPEEDPIGTYLEIKGVPFKVVGTFDSPLSSNDAIDDIQTIYLPNTTMQQAFNQGENVGWFGFIPRMGVPAATIEENVKALLAQRHKIHPQDRSALGSFNVEQEYQEVQGLFAGIKAVSWLVSIMTIIAGVVGVGNIMLIIVKERTKEFGVRKSVGAPPWSILSMIIMESLVLTGLAGYLGLLAGVGFVELTNYALIQFDAQSEFFANPEIDFEVGLTALLVLVVAGTLAGVVPAQKAARTNPVIALRDE
ncbi:MAG: ABC transporter ATP-binding protein [Cyclobacteriaceae bacterium]|nr:MAG: ABC transporter ATP-binding protein [Cyclobacteriaceae bacterium]